MRLSESPGLTTYSTTGSGGGGWSGASSSRTMTPCTLPGSTIVKWRFNHYPEWMFESDACSDLGAASVKVDVLHTADANVFDTSEKPCGEGQLTFIDLPFGTYSVALTVLDLDGNSILKAPVTAMAEAGSPGASSEIQVEVPHTAWSRTYTGQFLYRLSWGGMSCGTATPAVVEQNLTLTAGGQVVTATNDRGDKLDGTADAPCWALTEQFPQSVMGLPFGPATLLVVGKDATDAVVFTHQFDTFVGAGTFNPTFTFDVPPPDAGVDAAVDAPPDTM